VSDTSASRSATITLGTSTSALQSSTLQLPAPAPWLANVQRRLSNSVNVADAPAGQWLSGAIVSGANSFFVAASDLLQTEPYLYSSTHGDLVAEFTAQAIPLTMVFSGSTVVAMAMVNNQPVQTTIQLSAVRPTDIRAEVAKLMSTLRAAVQNGPVAAER
jgi:hypothetical protein